MTANVALTLENAMPDTFDIKPNDVNTDCVY